MLCGSVQAVQKTARAAARAFEIARFSGFSGGWHARCDGVGKIQ